jgi:UDPglucose 6-dehydrogenase
MKIGIIGQGFVGNAVYQKFKQFYNMKTYDLNSSLCNSTYTDMVDTCNVIFVCLPTPMNKDGSCNLDILTGVLKQLNELEKTFDVDTKYTVILKSTIPPGTTAIFNSLYENLNVVFSPEFLTERNAVEDFNNQKRIILGGNRPITTKLKPIFLKVFPKIKIIKTDSTYAEMVKYLTNTFLTTKVSFANEMYELCGKLNVDYDKIIEYATEDERLGKSHWSVPGPDGNLGYGGHCFPKDLGALIHKTEQLKTTNNVLKAVRDTNDKIRGDRDWEQMKGRAVT